MKKRRVEVTMGRVESSRSKTAERDKVDRVVEALRLSNNDMVNAVRSSGVMREAYMDSACKRLKARCPEFVKDLTTRLIEKSGGKE